MKNNYFYHFYIWVSLSSLFHIASIHFLNVHHTFAWYYPCICIIFSIHYLNILHAFVRYSPYISIMFTLQFHNILVMIIPSFFHLCFPPSAFSYYQKPYSCRHFIVELFIGKWIHAIYLSRTFLQPAIKPIPTIPSPTTSTHVAISSTHVATSATCHVAHPNHPIPPPLQRTSPFLSLLARTCPPLITSSRPFT